MKKLLAVGVVIGYLFGDAGTAAAQQCVPPQVVAMQAMSQVPGAELIMLLDGKAAQDITDKYNAQPPATTHAVDGIAVIQAPNKVVYVIGFLGNCTVFADGVEWEVFSSWLGRGA